MKMAKASNDDISAAMELCQALENLIGSAPTVPDAVARIQDDSGTESFNQEDQEQCARVLGYLMEVANRASLFRVVWGCAVLLHPNNQCVDPDADTLEHHPLAQAGIVASQARPLAAWQEADGDVLWWVFPLTGTPWVGRPTDDAWPSRHTHWTPLIVPTLPPAAAAGSGAPVAPI